jgi:hypothetical protein
MITTVIKIDIGIAKKGRAGLTAVVIRQDRWMATMCGDHSTFRQL